MAKNQEGNMTSIATNESTALIATAKSLRAKSVYLKTPSDFFMRNRNGLISRY